MAIETQDRTVSIERLERGFLDLYLLGKSPLVMNRMPKKAKEQLLMPPRQMNKAERSLVLKHNPPEEYRNSVYLCRDLKAPTLVHFPNGAFKKALAQAGVDVPGATKAQLGRLVKVTDPTVHIYGRPYLYMAVVRQAGINRAPDIRTRAIFPKWACKISIQYIRGLIREQDVVNLMDAAGEIVGIGDGRTEKGTFDFGSWELSDKDNKDWKAIVAQGRKIQQAAMDKPEAYDADTEELLSWFETEIIRREQDKPLKKAGGQGGGGKRGNGRRGRRHRGQKQQETTAAVIN